MGTPPMPGSIRVLVGYDGSPSSSNAVEIAAQLIPSASAFVPYLWQPPFTSSELSSRQMRQARTAEELADLLETEGRAEVERCRRRPGRAGHDRRHRRARPLVRARVATRLAFLGVDVDRSANEAVEGDADISSAGASACTVVVTAREDLGIARQVRDLLGTAPVD